jgi:hypothetical protein
MVAGGIITGLIAVIHVIWPFELADDGRFASIPPEYQNLLVLSSLAIGVCLAVFSFLSIYFSRRLMAGTRSAWVVGISLGIVWEVRAALEVHYPVTVPLFYIARPTVVVLPMTIALGLIYIVPLLYVWLDSLLQPPEAKG